MTGHATRGPDGAMILHNDCAECIIAVAMAGQRPRGGTIYTPPPPLDRDGPEPERTLPDVDQLGRALARACGAEDVRVTVHDAGTGRLTVRAEVLVDMATVLTGLDSPPPAGCCTSHVPGPAGACCDPDDCGPCCAGCPTCPTENARKAR